MMTMVWLILGLVLSWAFTFYAGRFSALGRKRIWAQGLVIAALVYIGFALWGWHIQWLWVEFVALLGYGIFAYLGVKHSVYWLSFGWGLHPIWDIYVHLIGPASHVSPSWYAVLCLSFDVYVAAHIIRYQVNQSASSLNH